MDGFKISMDGRAAGDDHLLHAMAIGGLAPWQVRTINAHIDANLDREIGVQDLAAVARLSTSHFGRAFKKTFGRSPHAYLIAERLERARCLMLATAEPLAQIAVAVGLADQSHLSRLFRKHVGQSPFAWRRARWTPQGVGLVLQ